MPRKPAPKTAAPPPSETQRLPSLDDISSQLLAGSTETPDLPPPLFDPASDEDDDEADEADENDEDTVPVAPEASTPKSSRRGFLGGIAAMAGAAAVAAAAEPTVAQAAPAVAAPPPASQPDLGAMMQSFMEIMAEREEKLMARVEARLAAIRPPEQQTVNVSPAELAATPGQHPMAYTNSLAQQAAEATAQIERQAIAARPSPRMVAFIPREDPHNPKQTTFQTWINGREIRAKRGQVMILSLGHGIDLARNGHGNCVDIGAMQGLGVAEPIKVTPHPNFARPADWNGLPMSAQSSVPVMNGIA